MLNQLKIRAHTHKLVLCKETVDQLLQFAMDSTPETVLKLKVLDLFQEEVRIQPQDKLKLLNFPSQETQPDQSSKFATVSPIPATAWSQML